ncbi:MAG: CoA transferase [Pirellulaceae bacterium]|nr:CoA transferase [Pirellulaceae bacterium]
MPHFFYFRQAPRLSAFTIGKNMAPLDGCRIIDLSLLLPGPLATLILRDLGAQVTKVEPPFPGDTMSLWPPKVGSVSASYMALNRGKEVVSLNLKDTTDRERFLELVRGADVVVEGFRPGVMDRLGFGYQQLCKLDPRIILCSITGYGQSGPYSQRAGHDLGYQAMAGVLSLTGGEQPSVPQLQVADTAAGSYATVMLILAALIERQQSGHGRHIDVSMSEQLLPLMTAAYAMAGALGKDPRRDGELLTGGAPCYRIYRTSDGHHVTLGALEPKFWQKAVRQLGLPELAMSPYHGGAGADAVIQQLTELFASKTREEWITIFGSSDACFEPVLSLAEVREHAHWQARHSFVTLPTPDGGGLQVPKLPGSLAGFDSPEADQ